MLFFILTLRNFTFGKNNPIPNMLSGNSFPNIKEQNMLVADFLLFTKLVFVSTKPHWKSPSQPFTPFWHPKIILFIGINHIGCRYGCRGHALRPWQEFVISNPFHRIFVKEKSSTENYKSSPWLRKVDFFSIWVCLVSLESSWQGVWELVHTLKRFSHNSLTKTPNVYCLRIIFSISKYLKNM